MAVDKKEASRDHSRITLMVSWKVVVIESSSVERTAVAVVDDKNNNNKKKKVRAVAV